MANSKTQPQRPQPDRPKGTVHHLPQYQPPCSLEAEQSVLGAVLLRPEVQVEVSVYVGPEDFYRTAHATIFQAMVDLDRRGDPVDITSVMLLLKERGKLQEVGGPVFLAELMHNVGTAANAAYYAQVVRNKAALRRVMETVQKVAAGCVGPVEDQDAFMAQVNTAIMEATRLQGADQALTVGELSETEIPVMEAVHHGGARPGLPVGYLDLAAYFCWEPEDLIILAGCPSTGKTALALNFALKVAQAGHQVGIFSLEMSRERLIRRFWANVGSINGERINQVKLTPSEWVSLYDAKARLELLPIWIDGPPVLNISQLRVQARRERNRGRLDFLIVDYLQRIRPGELGRSREEEVAEITRGLKGLAKELKIPVLALSTLNREVERRTNKRPMLSDLRESGSIEYESDIVMFLYRDEKYRSDSPDKGKVELIIDKNRNGRIGTCKLAFQDFFQRFDDLYEER